jgi:GTPase involved in cell partitioning and DNA repair
MELGVSWRRAEQSETAKRRDGETGKKIEDRGQRAEDQIVKLSNGQMVMNGLNNELTV